MQERHITVDGHQHELARPFVVIATQNPAEYEGTYPLPEAQLDRFMVRVSLGYPSAGEEAEMLEQHAEHDRVLDLGPVTDVEHGARGAGRGRVGARLRGAAPLRRRARRGDPHRHRGSSSGRARARC